MRPKVSSPALAPALVLALLTLPASSPALAQQAQAPPADTADGSAKAARELLRQAIDLYTEGRYEEAARRLRPLVETQVLADEADQKEALRTYGLSLYLSGARAGAEQAFRGLLRLDAAAKMDPAFVRPEVVAFFEELRLRYQVEMAEEARRRNPRYAVANLLPPWGQFQNQHRTKGYLILSGEILFIAGSVVSAALLYSWRDKYGRFPGHEEHYEPLVATNYASLAALGALLLYGMVDGLYYHYRQDQPLAPKAANLARDPALFRF